MPENYDITLSKIVELGNDTRHFELSFAPGQEMKFTAGQFAVVLCPCGGKLVRRAYSIGSPPAQKTHIDLCIKRVEGGEVTNWFWSLNQGDHFQIQAPFGKFILPQNFSKDILFIAVGTGIAPFRSMIYDLLSKGYSGKIGLLLGSRFNPSIPYHAEWVELAKKHKNFTYVPTVSRPTPEWQGETGYVQTKIEKFFPNPENHDIYICGLNAMIQAVQEAAAKQGYKPEQVHFERYD